MVIRVLMKKRMMVINIVLMIMVALFYLSTKPTMLNYHSRIQAFQLFGGD